MEEYVLHGLDEILESEYIARSDWVGMSDACPKCGEGEFKQISYSVLLYSRYDDAIIECKDYWFLKGSLYTECYDCDEILFKHPAYDIVENWKANNED